MTAPQKIDYPTNVKPLRLHYFYANAIFWMHVFAALAFVPWFFSWEAVIAMIITTFLCGHAINLCYHRLLAHRSFKLKPWVERCFVFLALCCMQDTPAMWAANHRRHHAHADQREDMHSPLVSFFWSHLGWLIFFNPINKERESRYRFVQDLLANPFYRKLEETKLGDQIFFFHIILLTAIGAIIGWAKGGSNIEIARMGASFFVWAVFVRIFIIMHITSSVNSITHMFGYRNYETNDNSRNNPVIGIIALGEGWHNNHHVDPQGVTVQHRWWEIDPIFYEIKLLEKLGLAYDLVAPKVLKPKG